MLAPLLTVLNVLDRFSISFLKNDDAQYGIQIDTSIPVPLKILNVEKQKLEMLIT